MMLNKIKRFWKMIEKNTKKDDKNWISANNPDPELIKQLGPPKFDETLGLYIWEKSQKE